MVALEFVLNIDELIQACSAPVVVSTVLRKLEPLPAGNEAALGEVPARAAARAHDIEDKAVGCEDRAQDLGAVAQGGAGVYGGC